MNSHDRFFVAINEQTIIKHCSRAQHRIILVTPGISERVAQTLCTVHENGLQIHVILDVNEDTCRLGYGSIQAVEILNHAKIEISQSPGIRTGLLITDDLGWSYSPTPQCIEPERQNWETPNAMLLDPEQIKRAATALGLDSTRTDEVIFTPENCEVGHSLLCQSELELVKTKLEEVPPVQVNLSQLENVFKPLIKYVEISLTGAQIQKKTIAIPAELAVRRLDQHIQSRMSTKLKLVKETKSIGLDSLVNELAIIKGKYIRNIPALNGNIMLASQIPALKQDLNDFEHTIQAFQLDIERSLQNEIDTTIQNIAECIMEKWIEDSRNHFSLKNDNLFKPEPTFDDALQTARNYFPTAKELLDDIKLRIFFKDVTYQSLTDPQLATQLTKAFPDANLAKPLEEHISVVSGSANHSIAI